ncbi:MAG TPA: type II toxin-antitoxin system prevent-host-death family antitoxin [Pseudonocardiaceae bacterium]|nr:type II toxin-antitoxin system prevent-host-death family antitoxin [Pseudonocardiaceae bacterium]
MADLNQVTVRELVRNYTEVLARVANGETLEITRNGELVAVIHAPDPVDAKMRELVRAGVVPPDLVQRQRKLLQELRDRPPRPTEPGMESASETLIKMRREERF